jgi:hypothetical protein
MALDLKAKMIFMTVYFTLDSVSPLFTKALLVLRTTSRFIYRDEHGEETSTATTFTLGTTLETHLLSLCLLILIPKQLAAQKPVDKSSAA